MQKRALVWVFFIFNLFGFSGCRLFAREPIRLGSILQPSSALIEIADREKLFAKLGAEVEVHRYAAGVMGVGDLLKGDLDCAVAYSSPILDGYEKDSSIRLLSVIHESADNTLILTHRSSHIEKPSDLEGKKVGMVGGTSANFFLRLFAERHGLDMSKIRIVNLTMMNAVDSFRKKKMDAFVSWNPFAYQILQTHPNDFRTFSLDVYSEFSALICRLNFIQKRRNDIVHLLESLYAAEKIYRANPDGELKKVCDSLGLKDCADAYRSILFAPELGLSNKMHTLLDFEFRFGRSPLSLSTLIVPEPLRSVCKECVTLE